MVLSTSVDRQQFSKETLEWILQYTKFSMDDKWRLENGKNIQTDDTGFNNFAPYGSRDESAWKLVYRGNDGQRHILGLQQHIVDITGVSKYDLAAVKTRYNQWCLLMTYEAAVSIRAWQVQVRPAPTPAEETGQTQTQAQEYLPLIVQASDALKATIREVSINERDWTLKKQRNVCIDTMYQVSRMLDSLGQEK